MRSLAIVGLLALCVVLIAGCGIGAHVELAAADAIRVTATELRTANTEYHSDLQAADDKRVGTVIAAFVARLQEHHGESELVAVDTEQFTATLAKIRADQAVNDERWATTEDNLLALEEIAEGLKQYAIESSSLADEWRRYVERWGTDYAAYREKRAADRAAAAAARSAKRQQLIEQVAGAITTQTGVVVP